MNTQNTFLKFVDGNGETHFVSVSDVINVGPPINGPGPFEGDEMILDSEDFYNEGEEKVG